MRAVEGNPPNRADFMAGDPGPRSGRTRVKGMQATVASHDDSTRSGHVLTDDGARIDYPAASLADHIRHLRVGQRVFVETDPAHPSTATSVAIWQ